MIFVIIGVVILFVSFIIALQSLLKEQHKAGQLRSKEELQTREQKGEPEKIVQEPTSVLSKEAQELLKKSPVKLQQSDSATRPYTPQEDGAVPDTGPHVINTGKNEDIVESREAFPWEKEFDETDAIVKTQTEEERIERIRSQLEQIKATKGVVKPLEAQKSSERTVENPIDSKEELSGEISLSDLKKNST